MNKEYNSTYNLDHTDHTAVQFKLVKKFHELLIPFKESEDFGKSHNAHKPVQSWHS